MGNCLGHKENRKNMFNRKKLCEKNMTNSRIRIELKLRELDEGARTDAHTKLNTNRHTQPPQQTSEETLKSVNCRRGSRAFMEKKVSRTPARWVSRTDARGWPNGYCWVECSFNFDMAISGKPKKKQSPIPPPSGIFLSTASGGRGGRQGCARAEYRGCPLG